MRRVRIIGGRRPSASSLEAGRSRPARDEAPRIAAIVEQVPVRGYLADTEARKLFGVLVCRASTQNGRRTYSDEALTDMAVLIAKDRPEVRQGHSGKMVPWGTLHGKAGNLEDGALGSYTAREVRATLAWIAEADDLIRGLLDDPAAGGLSIEAVGEVQELGDGSERVLSVTGVKAVAIVRNPGHGGGLWESLAQTAADRARVLSLPDAPPPDDPGADDYRRACE